MYNVEKNLTRLDYDQPTFFLDPKELNLVKAKLKKMDIKYIIPIQIVKRILFIMINYQKLFYMKLKQKKFLDIKIYLVVFIL